MKSIDIISGEIIDFIPQYEYSTADLLNDTCTFIINQNGFVYSFTLILNDFNGVTELTLTKYKNGQELFKHAAYMELGTYHYNLKNGSAMVINIKDYDNIHLTRYDYVVNN